MKKIFQFFTVAAAIILLVTACKKDNSLPFYNNGNAVVLTSSTNTIAPIAADSNKNAVTFYWTSPKYATDSSTYKFIVQIDSSGRNFAKATSFTVIGALKDTFSAKQLNSILLSYGFAFNVAYNVDVRVISSYGNNNEQYTSNTVTIRMTPYVTPPKVTPPTSNTLFLVGSATQSGWNNPVPVPSQQFSKIDSVTYGGVFNLIASNEYLVLPVNGDWSHKFSVADKTVTGLSAGGNFGYDLSDNIPGPAASGWYRIILDFQHGTFTCTPYTPVFSGNLFIVGSATAGGWNNPVPVPSQQLTRLNSAEFQISLPFIGGQEYLLLPVNGDWTHKFSVADKTVAGLNAGGVFGVDLNDNFPGPTASGTKTLNVNFATNKFKVQ